ncbi:MAG: hypothetical protein M3271_07125, partial [Actinomycetota bacterium]|nr:hypothetical protein [Actinomycetota bacterium]
MRQPAFRRLAVATAVLGLLGTGALLLPRDLSTGPGGAARVVVPDLPAFFDVLVLVATVTAIAGSAVMALAVSAGMNPERVVRRRGPVGALVLIVLAALLITLFSSSGDVGRGDRDRTEVVTPSAAPAEGPPEKESSRGLGWVLSAIFAVAIAGGSVAVWRLARVQMPEEARAAELERRLLAEFDAAIEDVEHIADPRAAVIACYGRLRHLAAASG